uniref:Uncharacterized protein n=1 Tax=Arundo donax TaxID=35708 RepID=A0A0A9CJA9_ARUDO
MLSHWSRLIWERVEQIRMKLDKDCRQSHLIFYPQEPIWMKEPSFSPLYYRHRLNFSFNILEL